jgi:SAM-dependent methyltransferase
MNKKILFISHKKTRCGVYEFGRSIADVLRQSRQHHFIHVECSSLAELRAAIVENTPDAIIYNYMPSVLPWIISQIAPGIYRNNLVSISIPQIAIIHDVTQHVADTATAYKKGLLVGRPFHSVNSFFDFYIAPDPTLLLRNPLVYKTGRLIPFYQNNNPIPSMPVIGSFGFGSRKKGFEKIVQLVQREFDEADIRFNIPAADFGDKNGAHAKAIADRCKALIYKQGIRLKVTHEFLDNQALLDFLAYNTINVFLYEDKSGRGLSSAVDNAMAVQRPIAVSDSVMFRHVLDTRPSVCVTKNNLKTIIKNGFVPLQKHYNEWTAENLRWEYERILNSIFTRLQSPSKQRTSIIRGMQSKWRRLWSLPGTTHFAWLRDSSRITQDDLSVNPSVKYSPVQIPEEISLNRILDNTARGLYKPAIDKLKELVPKTMSGKIPEANVQQAFVLDTAYRYLACYRNPRILCVGSYEDTASMSLIKMGCPVEEIDPMVNYSLQEFITKPTTVKHSYNIIFSTSVIEHDPDDESFIKCMVDLLAPGGVAILTCDYKDGWKQGDSKPGVDVRLYTQHDLRGRLLPLMNHCSLVDEPQWDCPHPDFNYLGKYQYTFATLVVKKEK